MTSEKRKIQPPQYWERGHLSFAGGGFLGMYNLGVVFAFKQFGPQITRRKALGAQAGAVAASTIVAGLSVHDTIRCILRMAVHVRGLALGAFSARMNIHDILREELDRSLPEDAHVKSSGRLFVSMTRATTLQNRIFSEFDSREELIEALVASCFIPFFLGMIPHKVRGTRYVDGGISNNLPSHDEETITVSPFSGCGCIRPKSSNFYLSDTVYSPENVVRAVRSLFPSSPREFEQLLQDGYRDALQFIRNHDLYACQNCARFPHRPRRGNCLECEALLKLSYRARVPTRYCTLLREAQQNEDNQAEAAPFRHSRLMQTLTVITALIFLPVDASIVVVLKAYRGCGRLWDSMRDCGWSRKSSSESGALVHGG